MKGVKKMYIHGFIDGALVVLVDAAAVYAKKKGK